MSVSSVTPRLDSVPASEWSYDQAAHLLRRACFGGTPAEIDEAARLGSQEAVERVLRGTLGLERRRREGVGSGKDPSEEDWEAEDGVARLRAWWVERLGRPAHPAHEKMVLFWHGHFTTSARKVRSARMLWRQQEVFREQAFGNFESLVQAMVEDPAMVRFLDAESGSRAAPNENLARELMELFTLGEGNFTEEDVAELARALTGLRIEDADGRRPRVVEAADARDRDSKVILGRRGRFHRPSRFVRLLVGRPQCAPFLCRRIWDFYAGGEPEAGVIEGLAEVLRRSRFELRPVLAVLWASQAFHAAPRRRAMIKSPVQWYAQAVHTLECGRPPSAWAVGVLRELGQELFEPPNVGGWPGDRAWITTRRLTDRYRFAGELVERMGRGDPGMWARLLPMEAREDLPTASRRLCMRLFQDPMTRRYREILLEYHHRAGGASAGDEAVAATVRFLMATPEYQIC